jgi:hypothetical protein
MTCFMVHYFQKSTLAMIQLSEVFGIDDFTLPSYAFLILIITNYYNYHNNRGAY